MSTTTWAGRVPMAAIASNTAGVASAWWVRSSPTMTSGQASLNTTCAASGSMATLNSATGVMLPAW
jgi:hypothetical protein